MIWRENGENTVKTLRRCECVCCHQNVYLFAVVIKRYYRVTPL